MIDLWHDLLRWGLGILQKINNLHRQYGLWQIVAHWKASLCVFILCGLVTFGAVHYYADFTHQRLLSNANAALKKQDMQGAAVFAMKVLSKDPNDIAACRVMTEAADKNWPTEALVWHARIEKLAPGDPKNCLGWARTALRMGNGALAQTVLGKMREADRNQAEYHWLAGEAALSLKDYEGGAGHLEKAAALSPDKADYAFELAKVRLLMPGNDRKLGLQELETLLGDPHFRLDALRTLFHDAERHLQVPRVFNYFSQIRKDPGVTPEDKLQYLDFLLHLRHPTFTSELRDYESSVRTPEGVAGLVFWMNTNDMSLVAIEWLMTLPPALRDNNKVRLSLAEAYASMHDWTSLKPLVSDKNWGDVDFLRAALLARCLAEEGDSQQSQNEWNLAVLKASEHPAALAQLCQTALSWGWHWETEAEDIAWRVVDQAHPPAAILDAMENRFMAAGETKKLHRLLARQLELDPTNRAVRNNFALVSLLLRKNENQAREIAQQVHEETPTDARTGSTYALSLYLQGQKTEALSVMSHFGTQLRIPSIAVYNGIFLAACGDSGQAREYLTLAKRARLLPEEQKMADAAEASLGNATPVPVETGTAR